MSDYSHIETEFLTDSEIAHLRGADKKALQEILEVWERFPENIKRILNVIWLVEKYCHDIVDPREKMIYLDGCPGNFPAIRYLLDTNTHLSDTEKEELTGPESTQIFYGWHGWNRYTVLDGTIKISSNHLDTAGVDKTIDDIRARFAYVGSF